MSYNADKPITRKEEDVLERKYFSKQLGRLIYDYRGEDGLVLGLYGEWGSGKTSVINMVEEEINRLAGKAREEARKEAEEGKVQTPSEGDRKEDENEPLIIRFSPWYYSDNDNLISLFFQSLKNKIDKNEALKERLGEILNDYVSIFDVLSFVPIPGSKAVAKIIQQQIKTSYKKKANLDSTKKALEKALKEVKKKIVIVIDDIDRLTNTQIRDIFQLVKSVGDLPYIIYVLAMDREIVARALTEVHQTDGRRYLEKIIQMPVELPKLSKTELNIILSKKIDKILDEFSDKIVGNTLYKLVVLNNCVHPYITTLRDVNRLTNVFRFRYGMLHKEVVFEDMLGITTLEVFEPELYQWIYNNKDVICGELVSHDRRKGEKFYSDIFANMGIDPDRAIRCIATMSPKFLNDAGVVVGVSWSIQRFRNFNNKIRVASMENFELYFVFNLENIKVPQSLINTCLFEDDKNQLSKMIKEANESGDTVDLLDGFLLSINYIPYERLPLIASIVFDLQMEFKVTDKHSQEYIDEICDLTKKFMHRIIKRFRTEEEIFNFIYYILENIGKFGLGIIARIIEEQEENYRRLCASKYGPNPGEKILNLQQLEKLKKSYVEKISTISKFESILELNQFQEAFSLWYFLDKEGATAYLQGIFKDEIKTLKFICRHAKKEVNTWRFYFNKYVSDVSYDKCYKIIQGFDKRKLDEFTKTEQIQLASFVIMYEKGEERDSEPYATEEEAEKLLNKWKTAQ